MAQRIFWNFEDDDRTFSMIRMLCGIIEPGVYRGFDGTLDASLSLKLTHHITGIVQTDLTQTPTNPTGVLMTKQGAVVQEDTQVVLPINAGDAAEPRIDIVVFTHNHVEVTGGQPGVYSVIEGVPGAVPVPPVPNQPNIQIIIGTLYVPATMTALNGVGVVWTRATAPKLANDLDPFIAFINKTQTFSGTNTFTDTFFTELATFQSNLTVQGHTTATTATFSKVQLLEYIINKRAVATVDASGGDFAFPKANLSWVASGGDQAHFITTSSDYGIGFVTRIHVLDAFKLVDGSPTMLLPNAKDVFAEANDVLEFTQVGTSPVVYRLTDHFKHDAARLGGLNRWSKQNRLNQGTTQDIPGPTRGVTVPDNGNCFALENSTGLPLDLIRLNDKSIAIGTEIEILFVGLPTFIRDYTLSAPTPTELSLGYRGIHIPTTGQPLAQILAEFNNVFTFRLMDNIGEQYWYCTGMNNQTWKQKMDKLPAWLQIPAGWYASGWGHPTRTAYYKKDSNNLLWLKGDWGKTTLPAPGDLILTLPAGLRPIDNIEGLPVLVYGGGNGIGAVKLLTSGQVRFELTSGFSNLVLDGIRPFEVA